MKKAVVTRVSAKKLVFEPLHSIRPTVSIRKTVLFMALAPILACVGVIGWISFYNGHKTVKNLTSHLSQSTSSNVKERLSKYLRTPHIINQANAAAIKLGQLNWQDPEALDRYFLAQSRVYPDVDAILLGYEQSGNLREVLRTNDHQLQVVIRDQTTNGSLITYELDRNDRPGRQLSASPNYDARKRDWYQLAMKAGKPVWAPPSLKASTKQLRLSAIYPILEPNRQTLIGVQAVELFPAEISRFLRSLKVSPSGQVFIVERSGELIAASSPSPILVKQGETLARVRARDSQESLVRLSAQFAEKQFNGLAAISGDQQLRFSIQGEDQLAYIAPFKDEFGLDWLVFVVIPEKDFMQDLQQSIHLTFAIGITALLVGILLALLATHWLVSPILQLNAAAIEVKNGTFDVNSITALIRRPDELGQLAKVFEEMAEVILAREQSLADQAHQLREETDNAKKAAIATPRGVNLQVLLTRSQQVRQLVEHERRENQK